MSFRKMLPVIAHRTNGSCMTNQERELFNAAQKVDMAINLSQKALGNDFENVGGGEGVEEIILDTFDTVTALSDSGLEFSGDTKDSNFSNRSSGTEIVPMFGSMVQNG